VYGDAAWRGHGEQGLRRDDIGGPHHFIRLEMGDMDNQVGRLAEALEVIRAETDIATVCREVLQGLEYIHSELRVAYGLINDKNIILTLPCLVMGKLVRKSLYVTLAAYTDKL
jgi:hypothetical protein